MNTILQVPMKKELRDKAAVKAEELGFSSLQEPVRVFLQHLAKGEINISFESGRKISLAQSRRYEKMVDEIEQGKIKTRTFPKVSSLIEYLDK